MSVFTKTREIFKEISSFFQQEKVRVIIGLILLLGSFYLFVSLLSFIFDGTKDYDILEFSFNEIQELGKSFQNTGGVSGAKIANLMINRWFGLASLCLPLFGISAGLKLMNPNLNYSLSKRFFFMAFIMIWLSIVLGYFIPEMSSIPHIKLGGDHGNSLAAILRKFMGSIGVMLLLIASLLIFAVINFAFTLPALHSLLNFSFTSLFKRKKQEFQEEEGNAFDNTKATDKVTFDTAPVDEFENEATSLDELEIEDEGEEIETIPKIEENTNLTTSDKTESIPENETTTTIPLEIETETPTDTVIVEQTESKEEEETAIEFEVTKGEGEGSTLVEEYGEYDPTLDLPHYKYPTYDLLQSYSVKSEIDLEEQNENKQRIITTLENYGVKIKEIKATVGPTITLYEIVPATGVRISKIRNLSDDIALSLSAMGIRIIAPIPGKGTVGIEVPNKDAQIVSMHSLIASKKFQECKYDLPVAIGKTITNDIFMVDLCKMPHLLVAGATGQGKSVGLNAILTSLLYKKHPSQLKLVLIDPKKVEFSIFAGIEKHFLAKIADCEEPIITDVTKVVQTLNSLCKEMDNRYDLLKKAHVRNVKEYNDKFIKRKLNPEKGHNYMPYIVVVIDEFGDLIMTAGKDIEIPISRIAQLARAVGIHMIIATQRPSTNIITGSIKANFPGRMAFRVASMIDSRTILDASGANQLIGRGDLLFLQGSDLIRVQCAFVDTPEIDNINTFIGDQAGYTEAFELPEVELPDADTNISGVDLTKRDALFEDAARLIIVHQSGSTSMIQRKFSIGYNRAGRIIDQLEATGIIGPADGSKARQVLVSEGTQLEQILQNL